MVFNHTYRIGLEDCGKENEATNKAILTILEDIAGLHSATVGLGLNEINKTGCAWVILKWQVQIIKRPEYNDELNVYTWSTSANKLFADRDFKVLDNNGETVIIATSRWIYMDINKRRPVRITAEIMDRYESEPERRVFSEEITKNEIPDTEYKEISYNILRRDVVDHVSIYVGSEIGFKALENNSLILTNIYLNNYYIGKLGLIGPLRMDYKNAISSLYNISWRIANLVN